MYTYNFEKLYMRAGDLNLRPPNREGVLNGYQQLLNGIYLELGNKKLMTDAFLLPKAKMVALYKSKLATLPFNRNISMTSR